MQNKKCREQMFENKMFLRSKKKRFADERIRQNVERSRESFFTHAHFASTLLNRCFLLSFLQFKRRNQVKDAQVDMNRKGLK